MTPTSKLRFVERVINLSTSPTGGVSHGTKVRILQQWWEWGDIETYEKQPYGTNFGEWRDVPLETE